MSAQPYLGRCRSCEWTIFAAAEDVLDAKDFGDVKAGRVYRVPERGIFSRCNRNHKVFPLKQIKGTYSEDHKCDSRCLNAKGNECTCSCGGANHGRGHAVTVHTASEEVVKPEEILLGEEGKRIVGEVRVAFVKDVSDGTLYVFEATKPALENKLARIKWFAPSYANPEWEIGKVLTIRAKFKSHEENEYGKATLVTYVEEI